ncbi:MAG: C25 family cysteine peptidase [bacterium]
MIADLVAVAVVLAGLGAPAWSARAAGNRLVLECPAEETASVFARLVPAPGGVLPRVEATNFGGDGRVAFGAAAVAGGVEVVPMVVRPPAGVGECRLELAYDRPLVASGRNVMGEMMAGLMLDGTPRPDIDRPGYLIIVPDDFLAGILPLAGWREKCGFAVEVRKLSETGSTRDQIRGFIRTAYESWDPAPSYVLLVGAVNKIEAFITAGTPNVTDHPYACVDGDDWLPDLFVGRLPAANASELDVMVAKTVGYEHDPDETETGWFGRALAVGTSYQEGGTPAVTAIVTKRRIREQLLAAGFSRVDTVFYPPTRYGRGPVDSAVNRGVGFVNGRGWGNSDGWGYPQFLTSDVYALENGWRLPVVTSLYCGTGNFQRNPCFGEAWLRAGTPASPRGAVAFWGSSWSGTSTRWNNCMDYGIYDAIIARAVHRCGPAMYFGKLAQFENFPLAEDSFDLRVYHHVYNLLGDPALAMWSAAPRGIVVGYPETVPVGTSSLEVVVSSGGQPVSGARVSLLKRGEVHAVVRTDAGGRARFALRATSADTLFVTITGRNLRTHAGFARVTTAGRFIGYAGHEPETLAPGLSAALAVTLRNYGSTGAVGVSAVLRSLDGLAEVTDSTRAYGDIAAGASATAPAYGVTVAAGCTSGARPRFELAVRNGDSLWRAAFEVPVRGPTFDVADLSVYDGNGWLDPGETAELSLLIRNRGAGATGVRGTLRALDAALAVLDSTGLFGSIGAGDSARNEADRFRVQARPGIAVGRRFSLRVRLEGDGGFGQELDFAITVGEPTSGAALGPDRHGYYAYDDTDSGLVERPEYSWVEIDPAHGGPGTRLALGDDATVQVDLPFTFRFYGRDYARVSISDNGYVAMGQQWFGEIYNWHIPSTGGLGPFVAVFWDDFRVDTLEASGVYTHYDAAGHRFVIEWSRVHHVHGYRPPALAELQTFQVVLHDPRYHPTPTGDGPILCQYHTVRNDDSLFENSHNYATVGIQANSSLGLEYTFADRYPAAAARLGDGRAIRFTTVPPDTFAGTRETGESRPGLLRLNPNPVRSRLLLVAPAAAREAVVYDAGGRRLRRLGLRDGRAEWDLRDEAGRRVAAGVYHLALTPFRGEANLVVRRALVLPGE